jgi:hypothetical protein
MTWLFTNYLFAVKTMPYQIMAVQYYYNARCRYMRVRCVRVYCEIDCSSKICARDDPQAGGSFSSVVKRVIHHAPCQTNFKWYTYSVYNNFSH